MRILVLTIALLFCASVSAKTSNFNITTVGFRVMTYHNPVVIVSTQPEWCPPCRAFEPVFQEVSNMSEFRNVKFYINSEYKLLESPGFIPWTYVYTGKPECDQNLQGYGAPYELIRVIRDAQKCLEQR